MKATDTFDGLRKFWDIKSEATSSSCPRTAGCCSTQRG